MPLEHFGQVRYGLRGHCFDDVAVIDDVDAIGETHRGRNVLLHKSDKCPTDTESGSAVDRTAWQRIEPPPLAMTSRLDPVPQPPATEHMLYRLPTKSL
jgi:hypothetical protein